VAADGRLAGLVCRAELLPPGLLDAAVADAPAWDALLVQPVAAVMWTPVPAAAPDTELRRVAELLLGTGLPGVPVVAPDGQVVGFVSRSDLLRAIVADPPLDLWS
jgi:CBS-domain-containing membrane protein